MDKNTEERERDELLRRLLKTPPQPRPKRERPKAAPKRKNTSKKESG